MLIESLRDHQVTAWYQFLSRICIDESAAAIGCASPASLVVKGLVLILVPQVDVLGTCSDLDSTDGLQKGSLAKVRQSSGLKATGAPLTVSLLHPYLATGTFQAFASSFQGHEWLSWRGS